MTSDDSQFQVPLALDSDNLFYTIVLGNPYRVSLWQGKRDGNNLSTTYRRPVEDKSEPVTLSETHKITILRNVPLTNTNPLGCD